MYVAVTGLGTAVLSPLIKQLVDRLRPIVEMPVATAGGPSFPSGHTLAVTVWVGVVLLVLLPVLPPQRRRAAVAVGVVLVVVVGLTRIALGVHFVSDVLAGWLVGTAWLLVTATAFRAWRRHEGLAVPPTVDGLAPEIAHDLDHVSGRRTEHPWTTVAQLLVSAVLLLGAVVGVGMLIVHVAAGTAVERADVGAVQWLADHRVPWLDAASAPLAELGNTKVIIVGGLVAAALAYVITRRWRPSLVIAAVLVGEVLIFLAAAAVVGRSRPPVSHLDTVLPPTSSFPSGHTAAAICLYGAIAALVLRGTSAWWRWVCSRGRGRRGGRARVRAHVPGSAPPDGRARQRGVRGSVAPRDVTAGRRPGGATRARGAARGTCRGHPLASVHVGWRRSTAPPPRAARAGRGRHHRAGPRGGLRCTRSAAATRAGRCVRRTDVVRRCVARRPECLPPRHAGGPRHRRRQSRPRLDPGPAHPRRPNTRGRGSEGCSPTTT